MRHQREETRLPGWLWFFLILPIGLILALFYKKRDLPQLRRLAGLRETAVRRGQELLGGAPARYTEPDSIPIDMHPAAVPFGQPLGGSEVELTEVESEGVLGVDEEDVAMSKAAAEAEEGATAVGTSGAETAAAAPEQRDNFDVIEGIGPAINALLHDRGIHTFTQLAQTPTERLDQILTESRLRRLADPGTWTEQARLASEAKWDELTEFQRTLKAGRRH